MESISVGRMGRFIQDVQSLRCLQYISVEMPSRQIVLKLLRESDLKISFGNISI